MTERGGDRETKAATEREREALRIEMGDTLEKKLTRLGIQRLAERGW